MLTRKCAIEQLLEENDFNVRVTIYDPATASNDPKVQKGAWIEAIRDSLGGGIVHNSGVRYNINLKDVNGSEIIKAITLGSNISKVIDAVCSTPQPLRITISESNSTQNRVWIIA